MSKELEKIPGVPPVEEKLDTTEAAAETDDSAAEDLVRQAQAEEEMKAAVQNALVKENETPGKIEKVSDEIKNIDKPEAKQEENKAESKRRRAAMMKDFFDYAEDRLNELKTKNIFVRAMMTKDEINRMILQVQSYRKRESSAISWDAFLHRIPAIDDKKSRRKINELEVLHNLSQADKDIFKDADANIKWSYSNHNFGSGE